MRVGVCRGVGGEEIPCAQSPEASTIDPWAHRNIAPHGRPAPHSCSAGELHIILAAAATSHVVLPLPRPVVVLGRPRGAQSSFFPKPNPEKMPSPFCFCSAASSSTSSLARPSTFLGMSTFTVTYWSPRVSSAFSLGAPLPRTRSTVPGCVPCGTLMSTVPSMVFTVCFSLPRMASVKGMAISLYTSMPSRLKSGSFLTFTKT
mmetsp:Transcript_7303/g.11855  ORF Transcript_7303/g.11855 Transcript_7303/m.11855 type:complete len:203 (+) Transcript_7303:322-930(+)